MSYYAVHKGLTIGVFTSWKDCKKSIDDFDYPIFRKYDTLKEAEEFVKTGKKKSNKTALSKPTSKKVYIKVPYSNKDKAKELGARWDNDKKLWYISNYTTAGNKLKLLDMFKREKNSV